MKTGVASQKKLSASAVDFPRVNENYTGRYLSVSRVSHILHKELSGLINIHAVFLITSTGEDSFQHYPCTENFCGRSLLIVFFVCVCVCVSTGSKDMCTAPV